MNNPPPISDEELAELWKTYQWQDIGSNKIRMAKDMESLAALIAWQKAEIARLSPQ